MLFSTIQLIFDGNTELVQKLKEQMTQKEPMIGETFVNLSDKICQYYGVFCNHQKEAMDTIERCLNTSPQFKAFLETTRQKPETSGLGLLDYLVKPFQRLLKYPLLLQELLKYTEDGHADYSYILTALEKLQGEVDQINTGKARSDNLKKMVELSQKTTGLPRTFKLMLPSRIFIYEGSLMKISGNHDQERHFFLFNDCLMYCKKKSDKFQCKGIIFLNHLQIEDLGDSVSFKVHRTDKNLTYILYGKSQKEKTTWLTQITTQKQKLNPSFTLRKGTASSLAINNSQDNKREIVRVYVSSDTFKTLSISNRTTARDLFIESVRKVQLSEQVGNSNFQLSVVINGKGICIHSVHFI